MTQQHLNQNWGTIHPVVMAVPSPDRRSKGRQKVAALGRYAREALKHSTDLSGVRLEALEKDENGAPLPSQGVHWSLSHKEAYVAAVAAPQSVGIDIEKIRPCRKALYDRIATSMEWNLATQVTQTLFFRYWTAKEAVLKAVGQGLTGLTYCRILSIDSATHLTVQFKDAIWRVVQHRIGENHIAAVTPNIQTIEWHLIMERK